MGGTGRGVVDGTGVPRTGVEPEDAELSLEWVGTGGMGGCPGSAEERDGDVDGVLVVWLPGVLRRTDLSVPEVPFTTVEPLLDVELEMLDAPVSPVEAGEDATRDFPISRSL